jgi:hypothetical protein
MLRLPPRGIVLDSRSHVAPRVPDASIVLEQSATEDPSAGVARAHYWGLIYQGPTQGAVRITHAVVGGDLRGAYQRLGKKIGF